MRRIKFKPKLRDTMRQSHSALAFMALGAPPEKREAADAFVAAAGAAIPPPPKPRNPANASPKEELETSILATVADFVREHPLIALAVRQNSGSASYEAKSGRWAPVNFYDWIKRPEKMRLPDIWGLYVTGRFLALEVKRLNWRGPSDDREREQAAFLAAVRKIGGAAGFCRSVDEARIIIES